MWRRLEQSGYESFEVHYRGLEGLLGYEVEERPRSVVITIRKGTAFAGRPIYHYGFSFKGRKLGEGRALITHWSFHESPARMSPATLGLALYFPEVIASAYKKTPLHEQEEILHDFIEELKGAQVRIHGGDR
jgi:hypothetical protein